jgi:hypothetical protein
VDGARSDASLDKKHDEMVAARPPARNTIYEAARTL